MNILRPCLLLCALCSLLLSSCMSLQLASQSGLYDVELEHTYKVPVDGFRTWGKHNPYAEQREGALYIAPLDVSLVRVRYPVLARNMVEQMHKLMAETMTAMLAEANAANNTRWVLTDDAEKAHIRLNLAVVKLRTQKPLLHVASKVVGEFTPTGVGDAIDLISKGNITLEGTIRDNKSGELILAFKDSNRAKLHFYQMESYRRTGHVDANLRHWAKAIAKLCRECALDRMGEQTLREKVHNRTLMDSIMARFN